MRRLKKTYLLTYLLLTNVGRAGDNCLYVHSPDRNFVSTVCNFVTLD